MGPPPEPPPRNRYSSFTKSASGGKPTSSSASNSAAGNSSDGASSTAVVIDLNKQPCLFDLSLVKPDLLRGMNETDLFTFTLALGAVTRIAFGYEGTKAVGRELVKLLMEKHGESSIVVAQGSNHNGCLNQVCLALAAYLIREATTKAGIKELTKELTAFLEKARHWPLAAALATREVRSLYKPDKYFNADETKAKLFEFLQREGIGDVLLACCFEAGPDGRRTQTYRDLCKPADVVLVKLEAEAKALAAAFKQQATQQPKRRMPLLEKLKTKLSNFNHFDKELDDIEELQNATYKAHGVDAGDDLGGVFEEAPSPPTDAPQTTPSRPSGAPPVPPKTPASWKITKLQSEVARLISSRKKHEASAKGQVDALRLELSKKEAEIATLKDQQDAQTEAIHRSYEQQIDALKEQLQDNHEKVESYDESMALLEEGQAEAQAAIKKAREQIVTAKAGEAAAKEELKALKDTHSKLVQQKVDEEATLKERMRLAGLKHQEDMKMAAAAVRKAQEEKAMQSKELDKEITNEIALRLAAEDAYKQLLEQHKLLERKARGGAAAAIMPPTAPKAVTALSTLNANIPIAPVNLAADKPAEAP